MIEIQTEKVIENGKKSIKIVDFKALKKEDLPAEYLNSGPAVYQMDNYLIILANDFDSYTPYLTLAELLVFSLTKGFAIHKGQVVSRDFWYAICKTIADAGKRLKTINERLKKDKNVWKGEKLYKW